MADIKQSQISIFTRLNELSPTNPDKRRMNNLDGSNHANEVCSTHTLLWNPMIQVSMQQMREMERIT